LRASESVAEFSASIDRVSVYAAHRDAEAMQDGPCRHGHNNHAERDERASRKPRQGLGNADRSRDPGKKPVQRAGDHRTDYAQWRRTAP
jgi:hypothetical protein